ncbi:dephospho-CoA kinase [Bizionia argentinensis JUB59]|uniref:Dephospho-CoA kinase n=1 Tax=Bizionia argentinensis JUB59 TaxID=1046627 RepID=G2EGQ2_9FLAO|nr:dephospho-CoA kinase [Bizionia argentinensis]EGV42394.1 dephospho-CoA kinase [Bizionia argentinensis JUB59]
MKIVGLTGGIGSGKTTVAKLFAEIGIPTYIADDEAKALMNRSKTIKRELIGLFGSEAYYNETINRTFIAQAIFSDKDLLNKMNAIVHPKVANHFKQWVTEQETVYVLKETAILFEHGGEKDCHFTILVTAPENIRIERVIKRDSKTKEQVLAIIKNQLPEADKIKKATFVIENIDLESTKNQVLKVHKKLLQAIIID